MFSIFNILKITGFFLFYPHYRVNSRISSRFNSKKQFLYNFLVSLCFLIIIPHFGTQLVVPHAHPTPKRIFFTTVLFHAGNFSCVGLLFMYASRPRKIAALISHFQQVNSQFTQTIVSTSCKQQKGSHLIRLAGLYLISISALLINPCITDEVTHRENLSIIPNFFVACCVAEYAVLLTHLEERFVSLNNERLKILTQDTINLKIPVTKCIQSAKKTWRILYETSIILAKFFALPMLQAIAYLASVVLWHSYNFSIIFSNPPSSFLTYVSGVSWIFIAFLPIFTLVESVHRLNAAIDRTTDLVDKMMDSTWVKASTGVEHEIDQFFIELLHRKPIFTACGIFPLDRTLLLSMIGPIITYIIILWD